MLETVPGNGRIEVDRLKVGDRDRAGRIIKQIYHTYSNRWIIYKTHDVFVEIDDRLEKENEEEYKRLIRNVGEVGDLRAEINHLLHDWPERDSHDEAVAAAMAQVLSHSVQLSRTTLTRTLDQIRLAQGRRGRVQYFSFSLPVAAVGIVLSGVITFVFTKYRIQLQGTFPPGIINQINYALLAANSGIIGALFSISVSIRQRLTGFDADRTNNIVDCALRLLIGSISGGILFIMLTSGLLPDLKVGEIDFSKIGGNSKDAWHAAVVTGFVAGFAERLVPGLLSRSARAADTANQQSVVINLEAEKPSKAEQGAKHPRRPAAKPANDEGGVPPAPERPVGEKSAQAAT